MIEPPSLRRVEGLLHRKEHSLYVHVEGLVKMGLSSRCEPVRLSPRPRSRRECRCDHVSLSRRHRAGPDLSKRDTSPTTVVTFLLMEAAASFSSFSLVAL